MRIFFFFFFLGGRGWVSSKFVDQLKVTEVFRRIDNLNMEIDITLEDPIALAEPWVAETLYYRLAPANWELSEISCSGDYLDFTQFENFLEEENN